MHETGVVHPIKVALRRRWPPMSQAKLARELDMNPAVLGRWLKGQGEPPEGFYLAAAEILGVPVDQLRPADEAEAVA